MAYAMVSKDIMTHRIILRRRMVSRVAFAENIWENTMKGHIGYAVLFMPIFLQSVNAMKNLLIAKGKLINPL